MKKTIHCLKCEQKTTHLLLSTVSFLTKLRKITTRHWKCTNVKSDGSVCDNLKTITHETKNKNYQLYDG